MEFTLVDLAVILSGFATTALVAFVAYQIHQTKQQLGITQTDINMTKQQMESSLRPWVGADKGLIETDDEFFRFQYCNYGQLPTKDTKMKVWSSDKEILRENLEKLEGSEWPYKGIIMPNQIKSYVLGQTKGDFEKVKSGVNDFWICLVIEYNYANDKKGEYGVIYSYEHSSQTFAIMDEWSK